MVIKSLFWTPHLTNITNPLAQKLYTAQLYFKELFKIWFIEYF